MQSSQSCLELKCNLGLLCLLLISASLRFMFYFPFFHFSSLRRKRGMRNKNLRKTNIVLIKRKESHTSGWVSLLVVVVIPPSRQTDTFKTSAVQARCPNLPRPPGSEPNEFLIAFSFLYSHFLLLPLYNSSHPFLSAFTFLFLSLSPDLPPLLFTSLQWLSAVG